MKKWLRFGPKPRCGRKMCFFPLGFWDSKFRWTPNFVCGGSLNWLNQPIPSAETFFMELMETEKKITKANLKRTPIPAGSNEDVFVFTSSSVRKFVIFPFWGVRTRSGAIYIGVSLRKCSPNHPPKRISRPKLWINRMPTKTKSNIKKKHNKP